MIVITHYQRLLNYIVPDFVHVLSGGKIVKSGGKELALDLEAKGYGWLEEPVSAGSLIDRTTLISECVQRAQSTLNDDRNDSRN